MSEEINNSFNQKTTDDLKSIIKYEQDNYRPEVISIIKKIIIERGEVIPEKNTPSENAVETGIFKLFFRRYSIEIFILIYYIKFLFPLGYLMFIGWVLFPYWRFKSIFFLLICSFIYAANPLPHFFNESILSEWAILEPNFMTNFFSNNGYLFSALEFFLFNWYILIVSSSYEIFWYIVEKSKKPRIHKDTRTKLQKRLKGLTRLYICYLTLIASIDCYKSSIYDRFDISDWYGNTLNLPVDNNYMSNDYTGDGFLWKAITPLVIYFVIKWIISGFKNNEN